MQFRSVSTAVGLVCLLLAISGWLLRMWVFMRAQLSALADVVPRMPRATEEMGEVPYLCRGSEKAKLHTNAPSRQKKELALD